MRITLAPSAKGADMAVVFASKAETEGTDLPTINLPAQENELISAVAAANPNTVVVLNTGSAVTMPWADQVKGILEAWYPGQEDGNAIAAVLFGDVDPSGKLPVTFPTSLAQSPTAIPEQFPGVDGQSDYSEGIMVGYRWYTTKHVEPLFPFGFGLSYTTFAFNPLHVSAESLGPPGSGPGTITVSADVTNTGTVAGTEVAQLYLRDPTATEEPSEQLERFQRIFLEPGQTTPVTFVISRQSASYWNSNAQSWVMASGDYTVMVGDSSENLPREATFHVTDTTGPRYTTISVPPTISAGSSAPLVETYTNGSTAPTSCDQLHLHVPARWTAIADGPVKTGVVAPGATSTATWTISAPTTSGPATITGFTSYCGATTATATNTVEVPYDSLAAADDNVGIGADASAADFDGSGYSYNTAGLASEGLTPGATIPVGGLDFTWPSIPSGHPDDTAARGQVIDIDGSGNTLGIIEAGTFGPQYGTATVTYTDGSASRAHLAAADWYANLAQPGTALVATEADWNAPSNNELGNHAVSTYEQNITLTPGKTPATVSLPNNPLLHVLDVTVGTTTPPTVSSSLAVSNDNTGIGANTSSANFDGSGYSYNATDLASAGLAPGAIISAAGLVYTWPNVATGQADNLVADNQQIALSGLGSGSTIGFLGDGTNGAQSVPVEVTYTDGTSETVTVTFADWYANAAAPGGSIVATDPDWNYPVAGGLGSHPVSVYEDTAPLDSNKVVASLTFGTNGRLHVFAVSIGG